MWERFWGSENLPLSQKRRRAQWHHCPLFRDLLFLLCDVKMALLFWVPHFGLNLLPHLHVDGDRYTPWNRRSEPAWSQVALVGGHLGPTAEAPKPDVSSKQSGVANFCVDGVPTPVAKDLDISFPCQVGFGVL